MASHLIPIKYANEVSRGLFVGLKAQSLSAHSVKIWKEIHNSFRREDIGL